MTRLAPHGGCNWEGCKECFPPAEQRSTRRTFATLRNVDMPDHQVEIIGWDFNDDSVPGYTKVKNQYGWVNVVKESRLTDHRGWW